MNRNDFFFKQLVTEAELDSAFDDVENAIWNLALDQGVVGIITGAVGSEDAPQSMNIDLSAPLRAYDQAGRRLYFGVTQEVDCSVDENSNPTVPVTPGDSRWIMIVLEFDRSLTDLRVDGNGASVYYNRDESFVIKVVSGATSARGTDTPLRAPTDALVLYDILLDDTTVVITNAMLDATRRQAFVLGTANILSVVSGSWTKIDNTTANVQEALDSVDTELISRNVSGEVDQALLPNDTVATGSDARRWTTVFGKVLNCSTGIVAKTDALPLGNGTERFLGYFTTANIYTKINAASNGLPLGDATNRFDAHLEDTIVYSTIVPDADGQDLGSATKRWDTKIIDVTSYNSTVAGAVVMSAAKTIARRIGLSRPNDDLTSWLWDRTLTLWTRTLGNTYHENATGPGSYASWDITADLPDEITLTELYMTYGIEVTSGAITADMEVYMYKRANTGVQTEVGSITTLNTTGAWQDDATIFTGKTEVIDKDTYDYFILVRSAGTAGDIDTRIVGFKVVYSATDIGKATLGSD